MFFGLAGNSITSEISRRVRICMSLFALLFLSACATDAFTAAEMTEGGIASKKVMMMPIDIELSVLNAGGTLEPQAAWTRDGKTYMQQAFRAEFTAKNILSVAAPEEDSVGDLPKEQLQLIKLHNAIGQSILLHQYQDSPLALPTKAKGFEWTLGEQAQILKTTHDADYALFVYLRDSYSSAGRIALKVLAVALVGVHVPGGQQSAFASLVDLNTGRVVWFNRLAREYGDVRNPEDAAATVSILLDDFPG